MSKWGGPSEADPARRVPSIFHRSRNLRTEFWWGSSQKRGLVIWDRIVKTGGEQAKRIQARRVPTFFHRSTNWRTAFQWGRRIEADSSTPRASYFSPVDKRDNRILGPGFPPSAIWRYEGKPSKCGGYQARGTPARRLPSIFYRSRHVRTDRSIETRSPLRVCPCGGGRRRFSAGLTHRNSLRGGFGRRRGRCVGRNAR